MIVIDLLYSIALQKPSRVSKEKNELLRGAETLQSNKICLTIYIYTVYMRERYNTRLDVSDGWFLVLGLLISLWGINDD